MDLIDRQAALDAVEKAATKECARWVIKELPKANVVHGYWIGLDSDAEKYDDIKCSVCGKSFTVDAYRWCDIGFTESDLNYCPNCGALMDEWFFKLGICSDDQETAVQRWTGR